MFGTMVEQGGEFPGSEQLGVEEDFGSQLLDKNALLEQRQKARKEHNCGEDHEIRRECQMTINRNVEDKTFTVGSIWWTAVPFDLREELWTE